MDEARYGELLKEIRPRIIETPEEHERLLSVAESLMEKGDALSDEEREALGLVVLLIDSFESQLAEEIESEEEEEIPEPHIALQRLMQNHGVELEDIAPIFGNPHLAREALDGRRPISRGQAKQLGKYFRVPEKLFREE
jgi:HTH-type transcriptional regulator / antitoxin HigA